ncbi:hypothetical protein Lalb_Chr02g0160021 [Lupinus albus]|uniref:CLASP domain-containing protein n=1 Tax=Lupinus albus TaxID=3870 RepID=A0A6A4QZ70_LUPAL|nr:hypothetical protein Lalb_Chr02g0160021 [Lupinus albus]
MTINSGIETGNGIAEIEYIESEKLNDLEDIDTCLKNLLAGLDSKNWIVVCDALNNVRCLSLFIRKQCWTCCKGDIITLVAKSLKNPRSALCKTAIMTSADIFCAYNDLIIDSLDPLASQDKRFVCEAAEKALVAMTTWISPILIVTKIATKPEAQESSYSCKGINVLFPEVFHDWYEYTFKTCSY